MALTSKFVYKKYGFTRQKLQYWREKGVFSAQKKTRGGHYRYNVQDLKVLGTIKYLHDAGLSTYRIRLCLEALRKKFSEINNPFCEGKIVVHGRKVILVHNRHVYDIDSGQLYLINFEINRIMAGGVINLELYLRHHKSLESDSLPQQADAEVTG